MIEAQLSRKSALLKDKQTYLHKIGLWHSYVKLIGILSSVQAQRAMFKQGYRYKVGKIFPWKDFYHHIPKDVLWLHTWCSLWGKSGTCCVLFLYFPTSHCCNNNGIRVMFLLISAIEEITTYCCYFPGYYCAIAALCRATFVLQNCGKATNIATAENSDCTACFYNIMQRINSNHRWVDE